MGDKQELSYDQKRDELLEEMLVSNNVLQMRVVGKDGESAMAGFVILKTDEAWYCSLIDGHNEKKITTSKSRRSARTALNSAIKKFLDREGFDEGIEMVSAKSKLDEGDIDE